MKHEGIRYICEKLNIEPDMPIIDCFASKVKKLGCDEMRIACDQMRIPYL